MLGVTSILTQNDPFPPTLEHVVCFQPKYQILMPDEYHISQGPCGISKFHHLLLCPQLIYFVPFGFWQIVWVLVGSEETSELWSLFSKKWAGYGQQEGPTNQGKHLGEVLRWFSFWELDIFFWKTIAVTFIAAGEDVFLQLDEADILHTSSWAAQGGIFVQIFWRKWGSDIDVQVKPMRGNVAELSLPPLSRAWS